ncbi:MAG TPA: redox-sensing transcriptional repressor Rex [Thermoguttaceae bacterium]|nr:redox-sensing transcriptional repressor Rex [Thermoguttaceae bacterium]
MGPELAKTYPVPSVRRLPLYLRLLRQLHAQGRKSVSCTHIAEHLGLGTVQVRKDLAMTRIVGRPKIGYQVPELIDAIESFLGWKTATRAILVGVGSLGSAILGYQDFRSHGLDVVAVFDADSKKVGLSIHGKQVLPLDQLAAHAAETGARIGIVTVPAVAAQEVTNRLVQAGLRAIWNFSPATLEVPPSIIVENVRFVDSLAVLSQRLNQRTVESGGKS